MTERWLPIPGYEGYYEVSDLGRVRSVERTIVDTRGRTCGLKGVMLRPRIGRWGYPTVTLGRSGDRASIYVHRLVLESFVGPRPVDMVTRHLNSIHSDNRLTNLAYGTHSENMQDRFLNAADPWFNINGHCPQRHAYVGDNLYMDPRGKRQCRTCRKARDEARRAALKEPA